MTPRNPILRDLQSGRWPGPSRVCRFCGESDPDLLRPRSRLCKACRLLRDRVKTGVIRPQGPRITGAAWPGGPDWTNRFLAKIEPVEEGCWRWTAHCLQTNGYGQFSWRGHQQLVAHRVAYELFIGPMPAGTEIDHLCRHRWCVNPLHLEAVAHFVNIGRSDRRKVTDDQAAQILAARGMVSADRLAVQFSVGSTTIYRIWNGLAEYLKETVA